MRKIKSKARRANEIRLVMHAMSIDQLRAILSTSGDALFDQWGQFQANKYLDELDSGIRKLADNSL